jgi:hypothetical protein
MESNGIDFLGALVMAVVSFPVSFLLARLCLSGVMRVVTAAEPRRIH